MKLRILFLSLCLIFCVFSCTLYDGSHGGCISIVLPGTCCRAVSTGGTTTIISTDPDAKTSEDVSYYKVFLCEGEYTLTSFSEQNASKVIQADAGQTIIFDALDEGVYSVVIKAFAQDSLSSFAQGYASGYVADATVLSLEIKLSIMTEVI